MLNELLKSTGETLYMLLFSGILSTVLGIPLGIFLYQLSHSKNNSRVYFILDSLVNVFRSIPFIILVLLLIPLTKSVMGTIIGVNAAIFNLTVAAIPFMGRLSENAFNSLEKGIIDSAECLGMNRKQFIFKVLLPETMPQTVENITLLLINLVTYSAIAGAVGAGGLGQLAINYGYYRFQWDVVFYSVIILVIISQIFQFTGNRIARKLRK